MENPATGAAGFIIMRNKSLYVTFRSRIRRVHITFRRYNFSGIEWQTFIRCFHLDGRGFLGSRFGTEVQGNFGNVIENRGTDYPVFFLVVHILHQPYQIVPVAIALQCDRFFVGSGMFHRQFVENGR